MVWILYILFRIEHIDLLLLVLFSGSIGMSVACMTLENLRGQNIFSKGFCLPASDGMSRLQRTLRRTGSYVGLKGSTTLVKTNLVLALGEGVNKESQIQTNANVPWYAPSIFDPYQRAIFGRIPFAVCNVSETSNAVVIQRVETDLFLRFFTLFLNRLQHVNHLRS